jgi:acetyltransferase-like isoleucine patch superfamily enzyme
MIRELTRRIRFWRDVDRLGPDIPWTHWRLHFPKLAEALCRRKFANFGEGAEFRPGAYAVACSNIRLGRRVVIRPGCMLFSDPRKGAQGIDIEDDVMLGSTVHIYVANHRFDDLSRPPIDQGHQPSQGVTLRKGAWIGAGAILLPGVEIGANAVIGAGSVVTRPVPPGLVAAGNPARVIRAIAGRTSDQC